MDDAVVDVRNFENACRLCLSTDEPVSSVFVDQPSAVTLAAKIKASLSIEIQTNDKLSKSICGNCTKRVVEWHAYREDCLRSQEKLQKCIRAPMENMPNIKTEPMDMEEPIDVSPTVPLTSDDEWEDMPDLPVNASISNVAVEIQKKGDVRDVSTIKQEPPDDEDNTANAEIESVCSRELLLNPMAVAGNKEDRIMEADSTQKLSKINNLRSAKKKPRRGPTTHYRGPRKYRKQCRFCLLYLHSKHSYGKHMMRYHNANLIDQKPPRVQKFGTNVDEGDGSGVEEDVDVETEEMVEDVEDELISLEKDAPLTPVQQNIISQLKTFSCYSCQQVFQDRRSTLNHIRQHMPDLRPYTCIACLTEFADRSIYKLHCGASFQCAMKIALVVPEHGTEKYFTCNMCLRSLANRKELLSHLSKHSDKQYEQLLAEPFRSPPKLKPMAPLPSPTRANRGKNNSAPIASSPVANRNRPTYKNDNPIHSKCVYCGMIYRYKQNLVKHVDLCKKLSANDRICYRCIHCGVTFLEIRRFHSHLYVSHKTREITCFHCKSKFTDLNDYSTHYRQHRFSDGRSTVSPPKNRDDDWNNGSQSHQITTNFSCALCPGSSFSTRNLLADHRQVHLKLKVYSCAICRRTFGRASALEAHMTHHELDVSASELDGNNSIPLAERPETNANISINSDPGTSNTECHTCGKVFANYPNLRRHIRTVHDAIGRYSCFTCAKTFTSEDQWAVHVDNEHKDMDPSINCPQCPESFDSHNALDDHRKNVHGANGEDYLACYICSKKFANESSLRIHRGHHFRVNSRLSIGGRQRSPPIQQKQRFEAPSTIERRSMTIQSRNDENVAATTSAVRSPRARKSFPNQSPIRQLQNMLQCQVCDDRFTDVSSLRKHLWDVHCARNKPEKTFSTDKLQCELCTNVMPDEESLASHMKWHETNPILSNGGGKSEGSVGCDVCGKFYSSKNNLRKHKKRHKAVNVTSTKLQSLPKKIWASNGFTCNYCRKVFATRSTLKKHKSAAHTHAQHRPQSGNAPTKRLLAGNARDDQIIRPVRPELDFDTLLDRPDFTSNSTSISNAKKPVTCTLCRRLVPSMRALYKHRQIVHKITVGKSATKPETEILSSANTPSGSSGIVRCTACPRTFSNTTKMRIHFTKSHPAAGAPLRCTIDGCRLTFKTVASKQSHEKVHTNVIYVCSLCPRHMLNRNAMAEHMQTAHKTNYATSHNKSALCKKISIDSYAPKGATGRQCPLCKIIYPNFKSMKIHFLKVHEGAA